MASLVLLPSARLRAMYSWVSAWQRRRVTVPMYRFVQDLLSSRPRHQPTKGDDVATTMVTRGAFRCIDSHVDDRSQRPVHSGLEKRPQRGISHDAWDEVGALSRRKP
jgi:hypothetical protein